MKLYVREFSLSFIISLFILHLHNNMKVQYILDEQEALEAKPYDPKLYYS